MFKALKTKADNLSMVGAFVLANNKENLNMDGCLWYFGGIRERERERERQTETETDRQTDRRTGRQAPRP